MLLVTRGGPIRGGRACVCMLRTRQAALFLFVPREKRKGADFSIHVACHFYDFNSWKLLLRSRALVKRFASDVLPESLIFPPSKGILFREKRVDRKCIAAFLDISYIENITRRTAEFQSELEKRGERASWRGKKFIWTARDP